ncbi:MAG: class I SAM-dependent methyltransferase [Acidobacteria bacterium]|nr:MAG: class I SAM-dependent methyltransferase [Acidobacteriota bacterium]
MKYTFHNVDACNMCGGEGRIWGRRLSTSQGLRPRKRIGISTTVMRCRTCALIYSNPLPIPESISDHYSLPPEDYWHEDYFQISDDLFRDQLARLKELVPGAKTFLDIGAGIGKTMRAVDLDAYGIEASEPFYERAISRMGISPDRLKLSSFEDADYPQMFDIISFGVVLEHLYDPSAAIEKALTWLNPGGIIHIEVPSSAYLISRLMNLYFWLARTDMVVNISPMHVPFHLYEFTERSFELNGERLGYEVARVDRYPGTPPIGTRIASMLSPLMTMTKTGMGLIVYLRQAS